MTKKRVMPVLAGILAASTLAIAGLSSTPSMAKESLAVQYGKQVYAGANVKGCATLAEVEGIYAGGDDTNGVGFCWELQHQGVGCPSTPVDFSTVEEVQWHPGGYYSYEDCGYVKYKNGRIDNVCTTVGCALVPLQ